MTTEVIQPGEGETGDLDRAVALLRVGELVAFPTETVYGLGADALNSDAVRRIFTAKGRPSDNPLIVHIADVEDLSALTATVPESAKQLMAHFWPGALTLVFHKSPLVPTEVTAGLQTVAIRMPVHPLARKLIRLAGVPLAAPSANRSGRPSPTTAAHVFEDMAGRIPMILDGGPCEVGVESTVLDMTATPPMLLRPGGVTREMIEGVIGPVSVDPALQSEAEKPKSPGMKYAHYAPKASMTVVVGVPEKQVLAIAEMAAAHIAAGRRVGILCYAETYHRYPEKEEAMMVLSAGESTRPETVATMIFSVLRHFDALGVDVILAEGLPETGVGHAVMNRLTKAAGGQLVEV